MELLVLFGFLTLVCGGGLLALLLPFLAIMLIMRKIAAETRYTTLLREQQYLQVYLANQQSIQNMLNQQHGSNGSTRLTQTASEARR